MICKINLTAVLCLFALEIAGNPTHAASDDTYSSENLEMRCGVNCLYAICRLSDADVSYSDLVLLAKPSATGISMLTLKEVAQGLGFQVKAVEVLPADFLQLNSPSIVLMPSKSGVGHFIVIVPRLEKSGFTVMDPPHPNVWVPASAVNNTTTVKVPVLVFEIASRTPAKK